jgi:hypothetical protein
MMAIMAQERGGSVFATMKGFTLAICAQHVDLLELLKILHR